MEQKPRVSIIIPNLNSPVVDRTLASLRSQRYDMSRVEILVVGLDEPGRVQTDERVRLIPTAGPAAPAVARNIGMREARGDLFCFTDADCVADPDWLAVLTALYADPAVCVVGGGVAFPRDNYWTVCDNVSWFHEVLTSAPAGPRDYLPTLNFSLRRAVVEQVGGIDERFPRPAGEDTEWTTRMRLAGHTLHFEPRAVVYHHHPRNALRQVLEHAYHFGYNSVRVDPRYVDVLASPRLMRHALPLLLLSPLLAAGATARIFGRRGMLRRYWAILPMIFVSKMSWCLGAACRLRDQSDRRGGRKQSSSS